MKDEEQEAAKFDAVFPCILRIIPQMVFNKKDPIIVGVDVEEGIAKVGLQTADRMHMSLDSACIATLVERGANAAGTTDTMSFGWLWFLATILPFTTPLPLVPQTMACPFRPYLVELLPALSNVM